MSEDLYEEMRRFRREMDRLFNMYFGGLVELEEKALPGGGKELQVFRQPLSDLKETDNEFIATIEMPGVEKKDIKLEVTENSLKVKAEKKQESKIEKKDYLREERSYRGFYRAMALPSKVLPERAKASYKDGVLEIILPKAEKKKTEKTRKVEIQ